MMGPFAGVSKVISIFSGNFFSFMDESNSEICFKIKEVILYF